METEQITALKKQIGRLTRQHVIDLIPASAITSIRGPVISLNQRREDCSIATTVAPSRRPSRRPASFDPAPGRPSRALNAFMAFRSYLQGCFSEVAQKERSGLLTRLWESDNNKAKWALIARVYSRVRDAVGRAEAPLSRFLEIACPTLDIPASFTYIAESGFVFTVVGDKVCLVRRDAATGAAGTTTVVTEEVAAHSSTDGFTTEGLITNEFELLCTCVTLGYTFRGQEQVLAELGVQVMRSQGTMALLNGSDMARRRRLALATFHRAVPSKAIPCLRERIASRQRQEFIDRVRRDPVGAAAEAMCVDPNHQILQMGINVRLVDDIRNPSAATGIGDHGPETVYATPAAVASAGNLNVGEENRESQALDVPAAERNTNGAAVISGKPSDDAVVQAADPYDTYNWADTTEHLFRPDNPVLNNTARDRFDVISIDNPYDVDRALGYKETEGERTKGMAEPAVYDPIAAIYDIF